MTIALPSVDMCMVKTILRGSMNRFRVNGN